MVMDGPGVMISREVIGRGWDWPRVDRPQTGLELNRSVSTTFLTRGGADVPLPGLLQKSEGRIWSERDPPAPNPVLVLL